MATVPDLSGNFPAALPTGIEPSLSSINRVVTATPVAALLPLFVGERVRDSTSGLLYISEGMTVSDWVLYTRTRVL